MPRREYHLNLKCNHEGCNERTHYFYGTKKEYSEGAERHKNYKCFRHKYPEEVLSIENMKTEKLLTVSKSEIASGLYWAHNGISGSGFTSGSGYMAHADEFPEGTILKVTAEIILPNK